ncbi:MAG: hypothetical protein MUC88_17525 [Planctomycetes bacterium]|jgi:hypothetical protein|nr:hypothetical protein [Planctomycetota bacterium]
MLIEIDWHPTGRQLRVFGAGGLLAAMLAALVLYFVWGAAALPVGIVLGAGAVVFLCSLLAPTVARVLYVGLTLAALPLGLMVSFLLLAALYFLLLAPVALVFKLMGRDVLERRFGARAESYWVPRRAGEDMERYFHQF